SGIGEKPMADKCANGASIELAGATKAYKDSIALNGIDLTIEPGEFVTLLGPSGSGKTTTLSLIAGFTKPTSGTVRVDGVDMLATPPHKRNLGVVFQHYALF